MATVRTSCARTRMIATLLYLSGRAVILDTETTDLDGEVIEVAVLDTRGRTLLSTLVQPLGPIHPQARAVHQITDDELTLAPTWESVLPQLHHVTRGKVLLAYNEAFDRQAIARTCTLHGLPTRQLANPRRWWCLMNARTHLEGQRLRLAGGHRALGDCQAALEVLHRIRWSRHSPVRTHCNGKESNPCTER